MYTTVDQNIINNIIEEKMEINFCIRCGEKLSQINKTFFMCPNKHHFFNNSSPTVGVFFIKDGVVTLSVRGIDPGKGMLDCFGGFLDANETFEQAIERELFEEAGLTPNDYGKLKFLCSGYAKYPYLGENKPVVSVFFYTELKPGVKIKPSDDVAQVIESNMSDVELSQIFNDDVKIGFKALIKKLEV